MSLSFDLLETRRRDRERARRYRQAQWELLRTIAGFLLLVVASVLFAWTFYGFIFL